MKSISTCLIYISTILITFFLISFISSAIANPAKYLCRGEINNLYVIFDTNFKEVILGNNKPKKYWTSPNFKFWHSAKDYNVYEYSFKYSYNKLSGELRVKSHHLVTSENNWYDYKCSINQ